MLQMRFVFLFIVSEKVQVICKTWNHLKCFLSVYRIINHEFMETAKLANNSNTFLDKCICIKTGIKYIKRLKTMFQNQQSKTRQKKTMIY